MLIEDLWFWGFFTTSGTSQQRRLGFNADKFYTADFILPNNRLEGKLHQFVRLVRQLS